DAPRCTYLGAEPQRAARAQVNAVETAIDVHGFRQPAGAARKVGEAMHAAAGLHDRHAIDRLERAQEHASADAWTLPRHVDAKMHAVDEVDVGVAAAQEQRAIPIRLADVGMAAGVTGDVGLGFDDAPARGPAGASRTSVLPMRKHASEAVSTGNSARFKRR